MPEWLNQLDVSDDIKNSPTLQDVPDVGTALKRFVDGQSYIGKLKEEAVKIPGPEAGELELNDFYTKIGRPASPDKYEINRKELPEGFTYHEDLEKNFIDNVAFKTGLTSKQAEAIINWYNDQAAAQSIANDKAAEEYRGGLKTEWAGEYDTNYGLAKQAALKMGGQEYADDLDSLDNTTLKILTQIAKMTNNDSLVSGQPSHVSAQEALDKIRKDPNHPFNNNMHPEHKNAQKQVLDLFRNGAK